MTNHRDDHPVDDEATDNHRSDTETDGEQDELSAEAQAIWDLLQDGEIEEAAERAEALRARAPDAPEVVAVCGAILTSRGQIDAALTELLRAFELSAEGDGARYLLDAAELCLYALDDPEQAVALCSQALDLTTEEDELIDGVLMNAEALITIGEKDDEARALLAELADCSIDEPAVQCRVGDLYATMGDWRDAERAFQAALALAPEWADAYHGLGGVYEAQERHDDMVDAWLRVLELDRRVPVPEWRLPHEELERVVEEALAELPDEVHAHLENVPIFVEEAPSEDMVREGLDPRLLGLFSGVPLPERSHIVDGQIPTIDNIHVFQGNLERASMNQEHMVHELRVTILHETAHFFGLEDHDLDDLGLG